MICIIGLGLFAFIAEEAVRGCETLGANKSRQVGEVLGQKMEIDEFQKLVDEYSEVIKMQSGQDNLNDQQLNNVRDAVWQNFVQYQIIANECEKLGLTVTDQELQDVLKAGTNSMLLSTPFVNQQTGRFDASALQKFLAEYKTQQTANPQMAQQYETIYKYWKYIEKSLRQNLLFQKYQSLFVHCLLSDKVTAQMAFNDANEESAIQLASLPYSSIEDNKVKIEDSDLKAKYNELKPLFKMNVETRDIKYIDVAVTASKADREALDKAFAGYAKDFAEGKDADGIVRQSTSSIPFLGIPVTKAYFPNDIAQRLDSVAVGGTTAAFENKGDGTLNLIHLVSKQQLPDSIQYRAIQVGGKDLDDAHQRADSIYNALQAGADFEALAKKYGQTGEKVWRTSRDFQSTTTMDKDTREFVSSLNTMSVNETKNLAFTQANLIVQVTDRKAMVEKYVAAVVKKSITFSNETYSAAFNKFSAFVSANKTAEDLVKNAQKSGYTVQEQQNVTSDGHYLANIRSTHEALKWTFDAKKNDVSELYQCGDNDHLLIVILNDIHPVGYRSMDDPQVKEFLKSEVLKDKKAEMLIAKLNGVNSIDAAKKQGAKVSTVQQVTFASPAFISETGATEPRLSGAVARTAKGKFCATPVKGNAGVYMFQVTNKTKRQAAFDATTEMQNLSRRSAETAFRTFFNELYVNAKVVDNRYLFF